MEALNAVLTAANYPLTNSGGCQLRTSLPQTPLGSHLDITVGNAPALIQLFTLQDPMLGIGGDIQITDEFVVVAGSGQIKEASWENCVGFRAKDFVTGNHATVYASLYEKGDPNPTGGNAYSGTLTGTGATSVSSFVLFSDRVLSASASAFVFSALPSTGILLRIGIYGRCDTVADTQTIDIQFNADGAANYITEFIEGLNNAAPISQLIPATTAGSIGIVSAANAPAVSFGQIMLDIYNYTGTVGQKQWTSQSEAITANGTKCVFGGEWNNTGAITQVTILPAAGNFVAGSRATCWIMS